MRPQGADSPAIRRPDRPNRELANGLRSLEIDPQRGFGRRPRPFQAVGAFLYGKSSQSFAVSSAAGTGAGVFFFATPTTRSKSAWEPSPMRAARPTLRK